MSSMPVANLAQLITPPEELECADYCFRIKVDFTKKPMAIHDLKRILIALLNTSGGFVTIDSFGSGQVDDASIDSWKRDLEGQLTVFIPRDIYMTCITLLGNFMPLVIKVVKSPRLITMNSNLFVRQMAGNNTLYDSNDIHKLLFQESGLISAHPLGDVTSLSFGTPINVRESREVEFKCWRNIKTIHDYKGRIYMERIRRSFFSLANLPSGGDLILGVEEDKKSNMNTIHGQLIREQDERLFVEFISEFLQQDGRCVRRIWGNEQSVPELGKHWNIEFIPVTDCPNKNERRRLIRIHFYHCKGGVFEHPPESYFISEDGSVRQMLFKQWLDIICQKNSKRFNRQTTQPDEEVVKRHRTESTLSTGGGADTTRRQPFYLWSKNRSQSYEHVPRASLELEQNILSLSTARKGALVPAEPLTFTPSRETLLASCQYSTELDIALNDIEVSSCQGRKGFAIASSQWHGNIQHNTKIVQPSQRVMDVFVMDTSCSTHLWCIVDPSFQNKDEKAAWMYSLTSGRLTKRSLLMCENIHAETEDDVQVDVQVQCHLYKLGFGILRETSIGVSSTETSRPHVVLHALKKRLAAVLLQKKTYIKNTLGHEHGIHLTAHQMEKVLISDFDRFNFVEGPPGSGKTYLAMHLCTKYASNKVAFVCTTVAFEAFLLFQGGCHPVLVQSENDLLQHIKTGRFSAFDCIIMDDVHNLSCSDETWTVLFRFVLRTLNLHLFILADSRYQSYKAPSMMSSLKQHLQRFCDSINIPYHVKTLNVVHRNTQSIVSFIKACFEDDINFPELGRIKCSHPDQGDDVEIRKMDNLFSESSDNSLVEYISALTNACDVIDGSLTSYQAIDVAVLVDTDKPEEDVIHLTRILGHYLEDITVHRASMFPVKGVTIDTLDNFLGLDRQVCIFVTSEDTIYNNGSSGRSISNPLYKAFVASRGVSKVVFAVPKIDVPMALRWKLNKVYYKASRMGWMSFSEEVTKMAFIKNSKDPLLLYITKSVSGSETCSIHLVSTKLRELPLSRDIESLEIPKSVASSKLCDLFCIIHGDRLNTTMYWTVFKAIGLKRMHTHILDGQPSALCWTPENEVVIAVFKDNSCVLRKYQQDGVVIWEKKEDSTKLTRPQSMTTNTSGLLYVLDDVASIKVLTPEGEYLQCITDENADEKLVEPMSILIDTTDAWLAVSQRDTVSGSRVVSVVGADGKNVRCMLQPEDSCYEICMYNVIYMAVATGKGLRFYDVDGFY